MKLLWLLILFYVLYKVLARGKTLSPWENRGGLPPESLPESRPEGYVAGPWSEGMTGRLPSPTNKDEEVRGAACLPGEADAATVAASPASRLPSQPPAPAAAVTCGPGRTAGSDGSGHCLVTPRALCQGIVWSIILGERGGRLPRSNLLNRK
ncbi:MAG: hypothetical protein ACUVTU_00480 [Desulfurispora sp.]|uniref:hypothetical protein n=1 Tax=Desulfurispora sp. TaxID=3014275 RepID=UPI004049520A